MLLFFADWFPKEQWTLRFRFELHEQIFTEAVIVTDLVTEPLLQWDLGEVYGSNPVEKVSGPPDPADVVKETVHLTTFPCAPDVALLGYIIGGTDLYLGRTYDGFTSLDVAWFKVRGEQFCDPGSPSCMLHMFDLRLTNHRLFIVLDSGLYMSGDLRNSSTGDAMMSFSKVVEPGCVLSVSTNEYIQHLHIILLVIIFSQ